MKRRNRKEATKEKDSCSQSFESTDSTRANRAVFNEMLDSVFENNRLYQAATGKSIPLHTVNRNEFLIRGMPKDMVVVINNIIRNFAETEVRTNCALHSYIFKAAALCCFNKIELIYLAELLNNIGFVPSTKTVSVDEHILFACLAVKRQVNTIEDFESNYLTPILEEMGIDRSSFTNWTFQHLANNTEEVDISANLFADCYDLLDKATCQYCKKCSIDYNYLVDEVMMLSLPYSEVKNNNKKFISMKRKKVYREPTNIRNLIDIERKTKKEAPAKWVAPKMEVVQGMNDDFNELNDEDQNLEMRRMVSNVSFGNDLFRGQSMGLFKGNISFNFNEQDLMNDFGESKNNDLNSNL